MGKERYFASNVRLAIVPADGGAPVSLTDTFDEMPSIIEWATSGIYFSAFQKTAGHLFKLDPTSRTLARVTAPDDLLGTTFSVTRDGRRMSFVAGAPTHLPEVFVTDLDTFAPRKLTDVTAQSADFVLGTREVISWKSKDGTPIEGVL